MLSVLVKLGKFTLIYLASLSISYYCFQKYFLNLTLLQSTDLTYTFIFSFAFNLAFATYCLFSLIFKFGISLRIIHWFYSFMFLGVAPLAQAYLNVWRHPINIEHFALTNFVILCANLTFFITSTISFQKRRKKIMIESNSTVRNFNFNQKMINKNAIFYLSSICAFVAISLTFIYGFHFSGSIIRRIFGYQFSAIESLAEFSIRPAVFFVFLISLYTYKNISKSKLIVFSLFFSFIGVVLIISPFSGARSIIFFLYFALILILFERYLFKWPIVFGASLFFGIFLSELQNIVRDFIATGQGGALAGVNYFFQGHFDGYEMLMHSISYVMLDLPVFGSQFIGAIFFWIPRAFWPGKPIGSGDFLAYEYIDTFSLVTFANFALPLHGELFLNFSFMGIFIGFFLIGIILGRFDAYFHVGYRQALSEKKATFVPFKSLVYCVSVGLLLFLYRGDMMSSFSFSFGIFFALWVTYRAATKNNSKQIK